MRSRADRALDLKFEAEMLFRRAADLFDSALAIEDGEMCEDCFDSELEELKQQVQQMADLFDAPAETTTN